jgi:hypothetical protein
MGDTYAAETHAVMDDCPLGAHAVGEVAVVNRRRQAARR